MITVRDRDRLIVAMTAFDEASSEGQDGIRAQIHSVLNRHNAVDPAGRPRWYARATLAGTCLAAYAYSAWNTTDPNRVRGAEVPPDDPVFAMCLEETDLALDGSTLDPTGGATHYYRQGTPQPNWVQGFDNTGKRVAPPAEFTKQIGHHLFFRGVS